MMRTMRARARANSPVSYAAFAPSPFRALASAWNWFDLFIVVVGWVSLANAQMPGISVLRLFRALKVLRLFRRIESIKVIVEGVAAAMPGMANAFIILGILMGIWAIIGVQFFAEFAPQEFGTFLRAMFTMWQVMTMDGWASGIARPLIFDVDQGGALAVVFFVSFTFVAGVVMANVVIAILLDKYLLATSDFESRKAKERAEARARTCARRDGAAGTVVRGEGGPHGVPQFEKQGTLLSKEGIIDMILETVKRKNLQSLAKDDLIAIALMLWHHPCVSSAVPAAMLRNSNVPADKRSKSIILNIMQRGITPPNADDFSARRAPRLLSAVRADSALALGRSVELVALSTSQGPRVRTRES